MNFDDMHKGFIDRWERSQIAVWHVAQWLHENGKVIILPTSTVAPTFNQRHKYKDDGDLAIKAGIEVKWKKREFHDAKSYGYDGVLVCTKKSYDRFNPKPLYFYICNGSLTYAAQIDTRFSHLWFTKEMPDHDRNDYKSIWYVAPFNTVQFKRITLKQKRIIDNGTSTSTSIESI